MKSEMDRDVENRCKDQENLLKLQLFSFHLEEARITINTQRDLGAVRGMGLMLMGGSIGVFALGAAGRTLTKNWAQTPREHAINLLNSASTFSMLVPCITVGWVSLRYFEAKVRSRALQQHAENASKFRYSDRARACCELKKQYEKRFNKYELYLPAAVAIGAKLLCPLPHDIPLSFKLLFGAALVGTGGLSGSLIGAIVNEIWLYIALKKSGLPEMH